jgi:hypothetical protein
VKIYAPANILMQEYVVENKSPSQILGGERGGGFYMDEGKKTAAHILHCVVGAHSPGSIHALGQFVHHNSTNMAAILAQQELQWLLCRQIFYSAKSALFAT